MIININESIFCTYSSEDRFLYSKVINCIYKYNDFLLSYSGGLDSTVLLDILANLVRASKLFCIRAIYVDHKLNINSTNWANHCKQQCQIRNIPFNTVQINDDNFFKKSSNIEAIARVVRYKKLLNSLSSREVLLTAHHMDDQIETVLLALKRGSGPTGLSGIHKNTVLYNNHRILRPLLECSRIQLEAYARRRNLKWIEDNTNQDIRFDRNFLRIKIIPLLKKRWPFFNIVVRRTAELCRNQENLLKELLSENLSKLTNSDGSLYFYPLFQYSVHKRRVILRYWLSNFFIYMPSYQLLDRIWKEVVLSRSDANPILRLGTYVCRRFLDKLYILPIDMISIMSTEPILWNLSERTIILPSNLGLLISQKIIVNTNTQIDSFQKKLDNCIDSDILLNIFWNQFKTSGKILTDYLVRIPKIHEKVFIRFGSVNGLVYILNRNHGRKLKKIWQELYIPPWIRSHIPLLFYDNTLISAVGIFITKDGNFVKNIVKNVKSDIYFVWRIVWIQDVSYYYIFKNFVRYS